MSSRVINLTVRYPKKMYWKGPVSTTCRELVEQMFADRSNGMQEFLHMENYQDFFQVWYGSKPLVHSITLEEAKIPPDASLDLWSIGEHSNVCVCPSDGFLTIAGERKRVLHPNRGEGGSSNLTRIFKRRWEKQFKELGYVCVYTNSIQTLMVGIDVSHPSHLLWIEFFLPKTMPFDRPRYRILNVSEAHPLVNTRKQTFSLIPLNKEYNVKYTIVDLATMFKGTLMFPAVISSRVQGSSCWRFFNDNKNISTEMVIKSGGISQHLQDLGTCLASMLPPNEHICNTSVSHNVMFLVQNCKQVRMG
ncbi:hypothetical protein AAMO2058_001249300 [Amorphochlora amoebiformis]